MSGTKTRDVSLVVGVRARRLCTALVIGAVFASPPPAHASDAVPIDAAGGDAVGAAIATVETAAGAEAAAIVNDVAPSAGSVAAPSPLQSTASAQTGAGSGIAGGITGAVSGERPASVVQASPVRPSQDASAARAVREAVVAAARPVVSQFVFAAAPAARSALPQPAPAAAFRAVATQYQENPGRYQHLNSLPISRAKVSESGVDSVLKRSPFASQSSPPKLPPIGLPKCLRNLPESVLQGSCENVVPQVAGVERIAVSQGAGGRARPSRSRPRHARIGPDRAAAPAVPLRPVVAPRRVDGDTAAVRTRTPVRRAADTVVADGWPSPNRARRLLPSTAPQREAAAAERSSRPIWSQTGLLLLLLALTGIGLAAASARTAGAAAVAAVLTRVRSKGLSTGAGGRGAAPRRGIRYRD